MNNIIRYIGYYVKKTSTKYNKNKLLVFCDMVKCELIYSASPKNYYYFGFANLPSSKRKTFTTHKISEQLMKKYNNPRYICIFENKYIFSKVFQEFYGRKCIITRNLTFLDFCSFINKQNKIIYKPTSSSQGQGIKVFNTENLDKTQIKKTYNEIINSQEGILETWIEQHPSMSELYPTSINPIRIATVSRNGKCHFLAATLTVGIDSEIANASIKALFTLIDLETGKIPTDACDYDENIYIEHPKTNIKFKGFQIPYWKETLEMLSKAAAIIPEIGYVGWDIAITQNGPIIIEGNNDPGYTGFQLPLLNPERTGTKNIFEKYL